MPTREDLRRKIHDRFPSRFREPSSYLWQPFAILEEEALAAECFAIWDLDNPGDTWETGETEH